MGQKQSGIFFAKGLDRIPRAKVICPSGKIGLTISSAEIILRNGFAVILRCALFLARLEGWPHALR
ncbi:hypothetical protein [Bradyrhizobium sp. S69]|uniref:hypothetical protein n=1 Tax=Bradyrhizobium sp. S69 TaxID=1641856 RepID=UPI00131E98FE|nr:hypothetical protein [Bradyrhizobium sp. S69]